MRILLVGATGTLGSAIDRELGARHELIRASRTRAEVRVDITDSNSILAMYKSVGKVDALVAAVGDAHFGPLVGMKYSEFMVGVKSKLMGQVDLVLQGFDYLSDGGSFTLTSGITERDPVRGLTNSACINAAVSGFVLGASIEMPRAQRINVVSAGLFVEAARQYGHLFPGHIPVPVAKVAIAFAKSVEGGINGRNIIVDR